MILREGVKAGSARRAKDDRIGGFHPVASREAALAGAARLGRMGRRRCMIPRHEGRGEGEGVLLPDGDEIRDRAAEGTGRL